MKLIDQLLNGDRGALAKALTRIENREPGYQEILSRLYPQAGCAYKVGLTGPPGSGKSTLVDQIAAALIAADETVGILAVDPTSPFTGGAFLGDRVRMQRLATDTRVFIRSMASRGSSGGLAEATIDAAIAMNAFGFDHILIETVGVGQTELEIAEAADTTVVVLVPESGDGVQVMKAGLIEIADIFVVNKADHEGADRFVGELTYLRSLGESGPEKEKENETSWKSPILKTVATTGEGIEQLIEAIGEHHEFQERNGLLESKRLAQLTAQLRRSLESRIRRAVAAELGDLDGMAAEIAAGKRDFHEVLDALFDRLTTRKGG
ncbi:MAG: methylmalonyl Co-A mutase-associated GTPase MeaB [Candidatus Bipolaricaulia bacterium]